MSFSRIFSPFSQNTQPIYPLYFFKKEVLGKSRLLFPLAKLWEQTEKRPLTVAIGALTLLGLFFYRRHNPRAFHAQVILQNMKNLPQHLIESFKASQNIASQFKDLNLRAAECPPDKVESFINDVIPIFKPYLEDNKVAPNSLFGKVYVPGFRETLFKKGLEIVLKKDLPPTGYFSNTSELQDQEEKNKEQVTKVVSRQAEHEMMAISRKIYELYTHLALLPWEKTRLALDMSSNASSEEVEAEINTVEGKEAKVTDLAHKIADGFLSLDSEVISQPTIARDDENKGHFRHTFRDLFELLIDCPTGVYEGQQELPLAIVEYLKARNEKLLASNETPLKWP